MLVQRKSTENDEASSPEVESTGGGTMPAPLAPLAHWPIQKVDAVGQIYAWWAQPAAIVTQLFASNLSLDVARRVVEAVDLLRKEHADEVAAAGGVLIFHDWSRTGAFDNEARDYLAQAWRTNMKHGDVRASYVCMPMSPFLRVAVNLVNRSAQFSTGVKNKMVKDVDAFFPTLNLKVPT